MGKRRANRRRSAAVDGDGHVQATKDDFKFKFIIPRGTEPPEEISNSPWDIIKFKGTEPPRLVTDAYVPEDKAYTLMTSPKDGAKIAKQVDVDKINATLDRLHERVHYLESELEKFKASGEVAILRRRINTFKLEV